MGLDFDTEKGDDLETIRQRLTEAAAWFEIASKHPEGGFPRSADLHPRHLDNERKHVVYWVARDRADELRRRSGTSSARIEGRLLSYAPDESVLDGASEAVTHGFFNIEEEPPWDLWLAWIVEKGGWPWGYLVCWIPPAFVETVQDGIDVNPIDCINWLPELERELGLGSNQSA